MALPMISYVYWRDEVSSIRLTCINIATLAGTLLGMVMFGFLADKYGRKKMYGAELVLLITATLGVVMSSTGEDGSMNIYAWLIWWRICVGIGVGADYPLSAVITSEYVPGHSYLERIKLTRSQVCADKAPRTYDGQRLLHAASRTNRRKLGFADCHRRCS